jgi:hypothetical protein
MGVPSVAICEEGQTLEPNKCRNEIDSYLSRRRHTSNLQNKDVIIISLVTILCSMQQERAFRSSRYDQFLSLYLLL